jgi:hypothetical protein
MTNEPRHFHLKGVFSIVILSTIKHYINVAKNDDLQGTHLHWFVGFVGYKNTAIMKYTALIKSTPIHDRVMKGLGFIQ